MTEPPVLTDDQIPSFVGSDTESQYRWRLCVAVARNIAGRDDLMLAELMYRDPRISTRPLQEADELSPAEREERSIAGKASAARRHAEAEARAGLQPIGGAPKPSLTAEEVAKRGYDRNPVKGEVAQDELGDAADTQELHRPPGDLSQLRPEERYTASRVERVHDPIVNALTEGHASQEEPHALIVAGGPASGKTTFLNTAKLSLPEDAVHLNADDIAFGVGPHEGIPEARTMFENRDPYAAFGSHREAGDIFEKAERKAIENRQHMVMDVTGNGEREEFERQLKRLSDAGYKVDMLYVSTPTDRAVDQNIHRAETEGRYVPTPVVRDKHRRVVENYKHVSALPHLNSVRVYDPDYGLVAFRDPQGAMEQTHEGAYAQWMAKADESPVDPHDARSGPPKIEEARVEKPIIGVPFELESPESRHARMDELLGKHVGEDARERGQDDEAD